MDNPHAVIQPFSCSIAFKEWSGICRALRDGRQTLILRKGGIAEGPRGFQPEHLAFWLFPTYSHQQVQGLRVPLEVEDTTRSSGEAASVATIEVLANVVETIRVERLDQAKALEPFHIWSPNTIAERFHYRTPGLWAMIVRAYRIPRPHQIEITTDYEGCKSIVHLAEPLIADQATPSLNDSAFAEIDSRIRSVLN